jgi:hypothetical protein
MGGVGVRASSARSLYRLRLSLIAFRLYGPQPRQALESHRRPPDGLSYARLAGSVFRLKTEWLPLD